MDKIKIDVTNKRFKTSDSLYGIFFEDINRAGDGGLYAELIRNRAFEDSVIPEGCTYNPETKTIQSSTGWTSSFDCAEGIPGWYRNGEEDSISMELTKNDTLNCNRQRALVIDFKGNSSTVYNDGFQGIPVEENSSYRFYLFAKVHNKNSQANIEISLKSTELKTYASSSIVISSEEYLKYECELISDSTDYNARFHIGCENAVAITIGFISLFPTDTYMGRENGLRKSLVNRLIDLKPSFLRFPGGCIVEGFTKETAMMFKNTIGPVWERPSHWLLWSYKTTNGLGYHEYLQLCEDMGIDGMYVFNCGMSCQGRQPYFFNDAEIEECFEDAVNAILYATAPADSYWGEKRAEHGHPEPFEVLKYLEIGNENWGPHYHKRYLRFYDELKQRFPQFIYISNEHTESYGLSTEVADEHFYSDPVFFTTNHKMYDNTDRNGPQIYIGEYASTIGCAKGNLYGALGEAAFLTGVERNQDIVTMTSYAPLFLNVAYKAWEPDLIVFNNHEDFVIPTYHVLKMYAENRGDYVLDYSVTTNHVKRCETGGFGLFSEEGNTVYKNVCIDGSKVTSIKTLDGKFDINGNDIILISPGSFGVIGDENENTQTVEFDITPVDKEKLCFRFWNTLGKYGDQKHYDWMIENNDSTVVHFNGWSHENIAASQQVNILKGNNHVKIITFNDGFECYLNYELIHKETLKAIPDITAVASIDEKASELIIKMVNISEEEKSIEIALSADTKSDKASVVILSGENYSLVNSFESKDKVSPVDKVISDISSTFVYHADARSVNVIRVKM